MSLVLILRKFDVPTFKEVLINLEIMSFLKQSSGKSCVDLANGGLMNLEVG
jgi:hypothetical protein